MTKNAHLWNPLLLQVVSFFLLCLTRGHVNRDTNTEERSHTGAASVSLSGVIASPGRREEARSSSETSATPVRDFSSVLALHYISCYQLQFPLREGVL